jgi:hypothetical protein
MPFDLTRFNLKDMAVCSAWLRKSSRTARSMEEAANSVVAYFREQFMAPDLATQACALARFFVTCDYAELRSDLQAYAQRALGREAGLTDFKCLVLMATAGMKPEWNAVQHSVGHRAIPLPSARMLEDAPMIAQLINQFGIDMGTVLAPVPELIMEAAQKTYNVFYVPDAHGSSYIPAQDEFVIPHAIRSVLGFGGMLPSGNLFAVILFTTVFVSPETANLFKTLSLSVKTAVLPFDETHRGGTGGHLAPV